MSKCFCVILKLFMSLIDYSVEVNISFIFFLFSLAKRSDCRAEVSFNH